MGFGFFLSGFLIFYLLVFIYLPVIQGLGCLALNSYLYLLIKFIVGYAGSCKAESGKMWSRALQLAKKNK